MVRVLVALVIVTLTTSAWNAGAATFTVNGAADTTDGVCGPAVGACTLREAIEDAVAAAGRDTILFDPTVFPRDGSGAIHLTSPLPVIADGAGTVIDGAGASVSLSGDNVTVRGLVFASAPGIRLEKVTVANLLFSGFTGTALTICGGLLPDCAEDVAGVQVRNVGIAGPAGSGMSIAGDEVTKVRVIDAVTTSTADGIGILVFGKGSVVGVRVERSTVLRSGIGGGIVLAAGEDLVGATVADALVIEAESTGINLGGRDVRKSTVTNVLARDNSDYGIRISASRDTTGTKITNSVAFRNGEHGIIIEASGTNRAVTITGVTVDGNTVGGIAFLGPTSGAKLTRVAAVANPDGVDLNDNTTGAKMKGVVAAANGNGMRLRLKQSTLQRIHASANAGSGITIPEEVGTIKNSGNTIKNSTASANGIFGLILGESTANVVQKNVALGNDVDDLHDEITGCDANVWKGNAFRIGNQPCVR